VKVLTKKWLIGLSVLIVFTAFSFLGLLFLCEISSKTKQEWISTSKEVSRLRNQLAEEQKAAEIEIQKAKDDSTVSSVIFGYIIGYLSATDRKLITDELPEFAVLTVQYANEFGVNPYDCLTFCQVENGFDLHTPGTSGEQGPGQVMKSTWDLYAKKFGYTPEDFYKWPCNYRVAICHYSALLIQHSGDVAGAIGEYNGGPKWANKKQSQYHVKKFELASRGISKLRDRKKAL
jgi:soluble lytic murein transglycosylase-like protein